MAYLGVALEESVLLAQQETDTQAVSRLSAIAARTADRLNNMLTSIAGVELYPRRSRRDTAPLSLFDVVRTMRRSVPLPRLLEIERELRPYLAAVIVDAIREAEDTLTIPTDL